MITVQFNPAAVPGNAYAAMRTHYKPIGFRIEDAGPGVIRCGPEILERWSDIWWSIWPKRDNVIFVGPRGSLGGGARTFAERLEGFYGSEGLLEEIEGWLRLFGRMRNEDYDWS